MTVQEIRTKYPEDTKDKTDDQLDRYCRSIELVANIFMDYAVKQLQVPKEKLDSYGKLCA